VVATAGNKRQLLRSLCRVFGQEKLTKKRELGKKTLQKPFYTNKTLTPIKE
jgi:hypothetical protein